MTDRPSVEAAIAETVARYGKLDILHNNAGGSTLQDGPVTEAPEEEFWRVIKLDLLRHLPVQQDRHPRDHQGRRRLGHQHGLQRGPMALPGRDCYTAAKGGVASMTRSMAVEYAPTRSASTPSRRR